MTVSLTLLGIDCILCETGILPTETLAVNPGYTRAIGEAVVAVRRHDVMDLIPLEGKP